MGVLARGRCRWFSLILLPSELWSQNANCNDCRCRFTPGVGPACNATCEVTFQSQLMYERGSTVRLVEEWRIEGTSGGVSCNREGEGEVLAKIAFA